MAHRTCPAPDCDVRIPSDLFACRRHWFGLPARFRQRVWRAYRAGEIAATLELYEEADGIWRGVAQGVST